MNPLDSTWQSPSPDSDWHLVMPSCTSQEHVKFTDEGFVWLLPVKRGFDKAEPKKKDPRLKALFSHQWTKSKVHKCKKKGLRVVSSVPFCWILVWLTFVHGVQCKQGASESHPLLSPQDVETPVNACYFSPTVVSTPHVNFHTTSPHRPAFIIISPSPPNATFRLSIALAHKKIIILSLFKSTQDALTDRNKSLVKEVVGCVRRWDGQRSHRRYILEWWPRGGGKADFTVRRGRGDWERGFACNHGLARILWVEDPSRGTREDPFTGWCCFE